MTTHITTPIAAPFSFRSRLREVSMFFDKADRVHETMRRVVAKLEAANISYTLLGGMAVNAHQCARTTGDVDLLLSGAGLAEFVRVVLPETFQRVANHPRRFLDPTTGVTFDILISGLFPGSGKPGPIAYPNPAEQCELIEGIRVLKLEPLVELKLAAGRYKDMGDVVELIRIHRLDETFMAHLHPSVHGDFIECLEEKRREDEYEARQDAAFQQRTKSEEPPAGPS